MAVYFESTCLSSIDHGKGNSKVAEFSWTLFTTYVVFYRRYGGLQGLQRHLF